MFDPVTNTFTPGMATDPVPRTYHSSAFLLPDGRVMSIGDNPGNGSFDTSDDRPPRRPARLPARRPGHAHEPNVDGCDHDYGAVTQCVPWTFPPGATDKCAWLAGHGFIVVGADRQHLDPDGDRIAC